MATKFLRKIILEELQKVLKEEGEFGGGLQGRRADPEAGSMRDIGKYYDQKVGYKPEDLQVTGGGIKCKNAQPIQYAIKNKFSMSGFDTQLYKKVYGRLSDNKIGPTTTQLVNAASGKDFELSMSGYQQICSLDSGEVNEIVQSINNLDKQTLSKILLGKATVSVPAFKQQAPEEVGLGLDQPEKPLVTRDPILDREEGEKGPGGKNKPRVPTYESITREIRKLLRSI